jgi:hypothetical protein
LIPLPYKHLNVIENSCTFDWLGYSLSFLLYFHSEKNMHWVQ